MGLDTWDIPTLETQGKDYPNVGDEELVNLNHVPEAAFEGGA